MKRAMVGSALFLSLGAWNRVAPPPTWNPLLGVWHGVGTFNGAPASAELRWEQVLDDRFYRLTYTVSASGRRFEGHGYYRVAAGTQTTGTWHDSEGNGFNLDAEWRDSVLTTRWGPGSIRFGKSYYGVSQGQLTMIDSAVGPRSTTMGEFSRFVFRRR